jgi:hypothetical protein
VEVESFLGFESFFLKIPKSNFHMNYLRGNIYLKKTAGPATQTKKRPKCFNTFEPFCINIFEMKDKYCAKRSELQFWTEGVEVEQTRN